MSVLCTELGGWCVCEGGALTMHSVMFVRGEVINGGFGLLLDGSEVSVAFDGVYLPVRVHIVFYFPRMRQIGQG